MRWPRNAALALAILLVAWAGEPPCDSGACSDEDSAASPSLLQMKGNKERFASMALDEEDVKEPHAATPAGAPGPSRAASWTAATSTLASGPALPRTVFWDPINLVALHELLGRWQDRPPWAETALQRLLLAAEEQASFPPGRGVSQPGPWSPMMKGATPPSGDKRDFYSTSADAWPCNMSCLDAAASGHAGFTSGECDWPTRSHAGLCGSDGMPWVLHDGFANTRNQEDADMLILTVEGLETLTLAFWYARDFQPFWSARYAEAALALLRTYFLDPSHGLKPNLDYSAAVPGLRDGSPSGMEVGTYGWNSRLLDSVELLKTSSAWTKKDAVRWDAWLRAWLEYLHASDFARAEEKRSEDSHSTWMLVHKLSVAYALDNATVGLQTLRGIRRGIAGSLVNQIAEDGAMPHELKGALGATRTRASLRGLFHLGVVAQRCCAAWDCDESFAWRWNWEAPRPSSPGSWVVTEGRVPECPHVSDVRAPRTAEECTTRCELVGANAFTARWTGNGSMGACSCRRCPAATTGMLADAPSDGYTYEAHVFEAPPSAGAGSVKKALDFALPYALGQKRFGLGNTSDRDAAAPWGGLAPVLRLAAWIYSSRAYEDLIPQLTAERGEDLAETWSGDVFNLLWPPLGALGALGANTTGAPWPLGTTAAPRLASTSAAPLPTSTTAPPLAVDTSPGPTGTGSSSGPTSLAPSPPPTPAPPPSWWHERERRHPPRGLAGRRAGGGQQHRLLPLLLAALHCGLAELHSGAGAALAAPGRA